MSNTYAFKRLNQFVTFIIERHHIYEQRKAGKPQPWTKDPILREYKFTNVYRELDRVTIWIREHWREPFIAEPDLWFSMVVARLINHPDTLEALQDWMRPGTWKRKQFLEVMHARQNAGLNTFSAAYIVSTAGLSMNKADYLAEHVLDPLWKARDSVRPTERMTLMGFNDRLRVFDGMGSFMAAQIVADMKYVPPLTKATDWWTFASSGPGSRKGMSYLIGESPTLKWREHEWRDALGELLVTMNPIIKDAGMPRLHAQDLQNCLCEFSKWSRTKAGTGRPKQKFHPFGEK